jgi:hypothetical protein
MLAVLCSARLAFADGALHYDNGAIAVALVCLALVIVAPIAFSIMWLVRIIRRGPDRDARRTGAWSAHHAPGRRVDYVQPELPVARTVKDSRPPD